MYQQVTSKLYGERAIKALENLFGIRDAQINSPCREIVQDIVSAAILAIAEIQKEAMESARQAKD